MMTGANRRSVTDETKTRARNAAKLVSTKAKKAADSGADDLRRELKGGLKTVPRRSIRATRSVRARRHEVPTHNRRREWQSEPFNRIAQWTKSLRSMFSARCRSRHGESPLSTSLAEWFRTRTRFDKESQWCGSRRSGPRRLKKGNGKS